MKKNKRGSKEFLFKGQSLTLPVSHLLKILNAYLGMKARDLRIGLPLTPIPYQKTLFDFSALRTQYDSLNYIVFFEINGL